jgi:glyceraldehyde-3-phosphate dehydrogenase (NADP+)
MIAVQDALRRAEDVQEECARIPAFVRQEALKAAAEIVRDKASDFARAIATDGIKTIREARPEVARCIKTLEIASAECRRDGGEAFRFDQAPEGADRVGWWSRRPIGVVVAITPYNLEASR